MVEVFKTNVHDPDQAEGLLDQIHKTFPDHYANFDLEDCDKILRVECKTGLIQPIALISFLSELGIRAEVLPDEYYSVDLIEEGERIK